MGKRSGFTMMEMITVLTVLVLLLSLSSAVYITFRKEMAVRGASGQVIGMFQAAHNTALASRLKTFVVERNILVNDSLQKSDISSFALSPVGIWHFDDEDSIATDGVSKGFGGNMNVSGAVLVPGKIGSALQLSGGAVSCPNTTEMFSQPDGVSASLWVKFDRMDRLSPNIQDCTIMSLGTAFSFAMQTNQLVLTVGPNICRSESSSGDPYYLNPERWYFLTFNYDIYTRRLAILVDGAQRGYLDVNEDHSLAAETADLIVGQGLQGVIDEVQLHGVLMSSAYELPESLAFSISTEAVGQLPYIRRYERGTEVHYIKITAFDERGWLTDAYPAGSRTTFMNVLYPTATEYMRTFYMNKQGLAELE
jgi:prepilin-type N-terminal cleavage/methylation domain-containing protein